MRTQCKAKQWKEKKNTKKTYVTNFVFGCLIAADWFTTDFVLTTLNKQRKIILICIFSRLGWEWMAYYYVIRSLLFSQTTFIRFDLGFLMLTTANIFFSPFLCALKRSSLSRSTVRKVNLFKSTSSDHLTLSRKRFLCWDAAENI